MRIILIQKDNSMSGSKTNLMILQKKKKRKKERTQKNVKEKDKKIILIEARDENLNAYKIKNVTKFKKLFPSLANQ